MVRAGLVATPAVSAPAGRVVRRAARVPLRALRVRRGHWWSAVPAGPAEQDSALLRLAGQALPGVLVVRVVAMATVVPVVRAVTARRAPTARRGLLGLSRVVRVVLVVLVVLAGLEVLVVR